MKKRLLRTEVLQANFEIDSRNIEDVAKELLEIHNELITHGFIGATFQFTSYDGDPIIEVLATRVETDKEFNKRMEAEAKYNAKAKESVKAKIMKLMKKNHLTPKDIEEING